MAQRVLIIDSGRRAPAQWKARLAPLDCVMLGPYSAPARARPTDLALVDIAIVECALLARGAKQLLIELRERCEVSPPLIVLTVASGDEEQRSQASRSGADEILEEPVHGHMLVMCIKSLLRVKAARDELVLRTREFLRAGEERRVFSETLVHDLKNPIAVAHLNLGWALERLGTESPEIVDALSDAQGGLMYLRQMVDDLLLVGMLEQTSVSLKREDIRVNELFDQAIKLHEREARARNVSLTRALDEDGDVRVVGDSTVLRRAISNMVESSLRHTPSSGKVALSARHGSGIEIAVSTTGRPLAPEERAQLLGEAPSAPRIPSGGLGLYFCRRAVEAHDGEFDVVESAGGPSSVVMRLPATG